MTAPKPLPCPFCGHKRPTVSNAGECWVCCGRDSCVACGPMRKTELGAIEAWNKVRWKR